MRVKQLSIFLENRSGRLREVTDILGNTGINIRALSLADTSDFGILRLIVNKPDAAYDVLKKANFTIRETDVLAVEVEDKPGGLARILDRFASSGINVEYMYAFVSQSGSNAIMIFRFDSIDEAVNVLQENNVTVINGSEVYTL